MKVRSYDNHTDVWDFNPCGYAFVAERGRFDFSSAYLKNLTYEELPMVLEWAIGNETCKEAAQNKTAFACKTNSYCQDLETTPGYRCKCERGYQGNPYLPDGCRDINECEDPNLNNCTIAKHCVNTPGNYSCRCPKWHHGSGRKDGEGCEANLLLVFKIAIGIGISFITMLVGSTWLYLIVKKRKLIRLKEKFFKQNGGLILEQLRRQEGSTETTKIFTEEELKKATSNYNESRIIGQGGEEALSFSRSEQERSVAMHFLCSLKEERLFDVLDDHVVEEGNKEQLKEVAELAKSCLTVKGEERPTMKDVAMELAGIRKMEMHPWVDVGENLEETEHLLGETSGAYKHSSGSKTTGYDSMNNHVILALGDGR
nr:wall-associated receptor kinase 2 [Quercus suber]